MLWKDLMKWIYAADTVTAAEQKKKPCVCLYNVSIYNVSN